LTQSVSQVPARQSRAASIERSPPMLTKTFSNGMCHVTFIMQPELNVGAVWVCGDFNVWEKASYPMERCRDGSFERTIPLRQTSSIASATGWPTAIGRTIGARIPTCPIPLVVLIRWWSRERLLYTTLQGGK